MYHGDIEHLYLTQRRLTTVFALTTLVNELGGVVQAGLLVYASLYHRKLTTGMKTLSNVIT